MKTLSTFALCALTGTILAIMGPFALNLFTEFMAVAEKGAKFDWAALFLFLIIGVFASVVFITGHCFTTLNKKAAKKVESYFSFLD